MIGKISSRRHWNKLNQKRFTLVKCKFSPAKFLPPSTMNSSGSVCIVHNAVRALTSDASLPLLPWRGWHSAFKHSHARKHTGRERRVSGLERREDGGGGGGTAKQRVREGGEGEEMSGKEGRRSKRNPRL